MCRPGLRLSKARKHVHSHGDITSGHPPIRLKAIVSMNTLLDTSMRLFRSSGHAFHRERVTQMQDTLKILAVHRALLFRWLSPLDSSSKSTSMNQRKSELEAGTHSRRCIAAGLSHENKRYREKDQGWIKTCKLPLPDVDRPTSTDRVLHDIDACRCSPLYVPIRPQVVGPPL